MDPVTARTEDSLVPPLLSELLGVHTAPTVPWLADAASTAAEHGLGALYSLLYLTDTAGELKGQPPASRERVHSLLKLNDALGVDLTRLRFDPQQQEHFASVLRNGKAISVAELDRLLPLKSSAEVVRNIQQRLGIGSVLLAPLYWDSEELGVLVLMMPNDSTPAVARAEVFGHHVAIALRNLRAKDEGRKRGELDAVRWVYDEWRLQEQLTQETLRARRHSRPLSILLLRVQNLEQLRQRFGRFLADQLLRQLAGELDDATRDTDFLGAAGDDGLAAILVEADANGAAEAERRLLQGIGAIRLRHTDLPGLQFQFACATATLPQDGDTSRELTDAAEARLAPIEEPRAAAG